MKPLYPRAATALVSATAVLASAGRFAQGESSSSGVPQEETMSRPAAIHLRWTQVGHQRLEFMRQQRCGYGPWLDAACHTYDGRTAYGPRPAGSRVDATGGWHDAGDLLECLLTTSNATAQRLMAYEAAPGIFADQVDACGRKGPNGLPDVLDEARWGLEWMLKLHPERGELYHQVADDRDHHGWRLPQDETADYGWGPGEARVVHLADGEPQGLGDYRSASTGVANLAGRYAAAMALAHRVLGGRPDQRPFAERCLQAGLEVYRLGREKEGVQQGNSYGTPYRRDAERYAGLAATES